MDARESRPRVMLLSGGLDSAAALFALDPRPNHALYIDYGQVSVPGELRAARRLAQFCGLSLEVVQVPGLAALGAGRLARASEACEADGSSQLQREEWFPARNLVLIAVGGVVLGREGGGELCLGASSPAYRDGSPQFLAAARAALREALPVHVHVDVIVPPASRRDVVQAAVDRGLEPRITFSCNRRGDRHCWRCASCRDRRVALEDLRAQA